MIACALSKKMLTLPRLQQPVCGLNLKTATLVTLYTVLIFSFVGLVLVTAFRLENESRIMEDTEIDFQYVTNMVVAICIFLITPVALYGTHHERANFLLPYMAMQVLGIFLIVINFVIEFVQLFEDAPHGLRHVTFLFFGSVFVCYSFLIVHSHYTCLKEQREEIK